MQADREMVEDWPDTVCNEDRFYDDLDTAVEQLVDDCWSASEQRYILNSLPEFLEGCELRAADYVLPDGYFTEELAELIDRIDESEDGCSSDEDYFSHNMSEDEFKRLDQRVTLAVRAILSDWMENTVGWKLWYPCGKYILLRPLADAYIAEREKEDGVKLT